MNSDIFAPLEDIMKAAEAVQRFVSESTFEDFSRNELLLAAVERKFEIIGEAIVRVRRIDQIALESVRGYRQIVAFRNILAHGYDTIDERIVWDIIQEDLPLLIEDVLSLMAMK